MPPQCGQGSAGFEQAAPEGEMKEKKIKRLNRQGRRV
jgi:hypothetical protein